MRRLYGGGGIVFLLLPTTFSHLLFFALLLLPGALEKGFEAQGLDGAQWEHAAVPCPLAENYTSACARQVNTCKYVWLKMRH